MAVWLVHREHTFTVDDDVIRSADFAVLTEADRLLREAEIEREHILNDARDQATRLLEKAELEIERMATEARSMLHSAQAVGMDQGMTRACEEWASNAIDKAGAERRQMNRQTERLTQLVSMAVERIIDQEDRSSLYRRSLRTVLKLMQDAPLLSMRVHPQDEEAAKEAVQSLRAQLPPDLKLDILSDPGMEIGACRFESDEGVIDTSLNTQLNALRGALSRSFAAMSAEDVFEHAQHDDAPAATGGGFAHGGATGSSSTIECAP